MRELTYRFKVIEQCNMCHAGQKKFKILGKRLNQSQGFRPVGKMGITTTVVQCSNCGLIFSNPMPIPLNIQDHYGVPPENYWKDEYFKVDENYFTEEIKRLKTLMNVVPGMKSLDVGAGLGKQMIALEKHGFETYGLEASVPFYNRAIEKMGIRKDRLQLCSVEEAEYEKNSFDFISFSAVLEHFYDPSASIGNALQWLKPGGLIHIEVPSASWLINRIVNLVYKVRGQDYVTNISPMHNPYHLYEFSERSFQSNAQLLGYKIVFHQFYVADTFMPKIFDPFLKWYMGKTGTGMQLSIWLKK